MITTAGQHYPAAHGPARLALFDEAARAGGVTLYGTGLRTKAGQYVTAAAVINAIPDVVAAPPGVFTPPVFAPFVRRRA